MIAYLLLKVNISVLFPKNHACSGKRLRRCLGVNR